MRIIRNVCLKVIQILNVWSIILAGMLIAASPADAVSANVNVLFILDGSGSMWARLGDDPKIVIAKEQMTALIQDLKKVNMGLIAYGHRRKSDCKDIELMVPMGMDTEKTIIQKIQSINPKGRTPITKSLELAAQQLKPRKEETRIVLISDGIETCEGDPCTFVQGLKEKGIKFKLDVIGFAVSDKAHPQLECMAKAGEGRYFTAQSVAQLQQAFAEVKKEIKKKAAAKPGLKLRAVLKKGAATISEDVNWWVYEAQTDSNGERKSITNSGEASPFFVLPTGRYYITAEHGEAFADTEVGVTAGEYQEVTINLNAGYLQLEAVSQKGAKPLAEDMYWQIYEAQKDSDGNRKHVTNSGNAVPQITLSAGRYYLTAEHGQASSDMEVVVTAGDRKNVTLNMKAGYLRLNAIPKKGMEPLADDLYWQVYEARPGSDGHRRHITNSGNANPQFTLSEGRYYITAEYGQALGATEVAVSAGELKEVTLDLNVGVLRLDAVPKAGTEPIAEDIYWQVYEAQKDADGNRKHVTNTSNATPLFKLSAGNYFITAEHGQASASLEVTVTAGETKETTMNLNAGYLRFTAVPKDGAEPFTKDLYWRVYEAKKNQDGTRRQITNSSNANPLFKLTSGSYYITATHEKDQASVIVDVAAGEHKKTTINLSIIE